jgi:hypothetical protein
MQFSRKSLGSALFSALLVGAGMAACSSPPADNAPPGVDAGVDESAGQVDSGAPPPADGSTVDGGACSSNADCEKKIPATSPADCAEAECDLLQHRCFFRSKDKDGDGHRASKCAATGAGTIETGDDCDDTDGTTFAGAWDGPAVDGHEDRCDKKDHDCDGTPNDSVGLNGASCICTPGQVADCSLDGNGNPINWPGGAPQGECKYGKKTCAVLVASKGGEWGLCEGAVIPKTVESCAGKDENCNGVIDDGCACTNGTTQPCGSAVGSCRKGQQTCVSGQWGASCVGSIIPKQFDTCDQGNDDNCNGTPNEGCTCINTTLRNCGVNVGSCRYGKETCAQGQWGICVNSIEPKAHDSCEAGNDDNCNGTPNEGCDCINGTTKNCGSNVGSCSYGTQTCSGGAWGSCVGGVIPKQFDTCVTGNDDNCNGVPNEGCSCADGATQDCDQTAQGQTINWPVLKNGQPLAPCARGKQSCSQGKWGTCNGAKPPAPEMCATYGVDSDCDGVIGTPADATTYYCDNDGDGHLPASPTTTKACSLPATGCKNWLTSGPRDDCNDADVTIHPGATETCGDSIDKNCDGNDSDGFNVGSTCNVTPAYQYGAATNGACKNGGKIICNGVSATSCKSGNVAIGTHATKYWQLTAAPNGSEDWDCDGSVSHGAEAFEDAANATVYAFRKAAEWSPNQVCSRGTGYTKAICEAPAFAPDTSYVTSTCQACTSVLQSCYSDCYVTALPCGSTLRAMNCQSQTDAAHTCLSGSVGSATLSCQ